MKNINAKTALITGASGGIGLDLAKLFAADGYNLVLVARNRDKLAQIQKDLESEYKIKTNVIVKDLTSLNSPWEIVNVLKKEKIKIDALVNNAGAGGFGFFKDIDLEKHLQLIQLDVVSLVSLTGLLLPDMIKNKSGKILNVSSTAAFLPGPLMAVYYAGKAFVLSFSEALASELEGTGVTVSLLCPGPTQTDFQKQAKMDDSKLGRGFMSSRTVAKIGYDGLNAKKAVVVPGWMNKLTVFLPRVLPRKTVVWLVRRSQNQVFDNHSV